MASEKAVKCIFFLPQTFNAPCTPLLPAMCVFFRVRACCRGDRERKRSICVHAFRNYEGVSFSQLLILENKASR